MSRLYLFLLLGLCLAGCQSPPERPATLYQLLENEESIAGRDAYRSSPYLTAGDRLYVVGQQDGTFPDLGWHLPGEMGGVWAHPIKLFDKYGLQVTVAGDTFCPPAAAAYQQYPVASVLAYTYPKAMLKVTQTQFVPDDLPGLVMEYTLHNLSQTEQTYDLRFQAVSDLRPTWLGERTGMIDAPDAVVRAAGNEGYLTDTENPWFAGVRVDQPATSSKIAADCPVLQKTMGQGVPLVFTTSLTLDSQERTILRFFLAGSDQELEQVGQVLDQLQAQAPQLLQAKVKRYRQMARTARLKVPDTLLAKAWRWTQYATDWLRFEQPGIGTGLAAGIPDYPWFFGCDQTYSVRGLVAAGMPELARDILLTLLDLSEKTNGNGRIIHEASTNGAVFNPGNLNETPHFISACWDYFTWTADTAFLAKAWPYCRQGLSWLEEQDHDGNGYPDGHGMMEIRGMDAEMIDVIAYTAEAYLAAAKMANWFEQPDLARQYRAKGEQLRQKINTEWWVASAKSFADFRSEAPKATQLLRDAIVRADTLGKPWSVADLRAVTISNEPGIRPYAFYQNWVVNTPMETGLADSRLALPALKTARRYTNPFGSYVTGIDRKAEQEDPDGFAALKSKESFNYTGAVMTLPTGVQAISEARYGRVDTAYDYLQRMLRSFSYAAPGSMYEVSPDYGMLVQAWNIYALARPVVVHFLGIEPQAQQKTIRLQPQLPTTWPTAAIYDLPVGDATLTLQIQANQWTAELSQEGWTIEWVIPAGRTLMEQEDAIEIVDGKRLLRTTQATSSLTFKP